MTNDQILNKLIYNQKKVTYSNISDIFELNFKKISRLIPLLASIKSDFIGIKKPSNDLFLLCHDTHIKYLKMKASMLMPNTNKKMSK